MVRRLVVVAIGALALLGPARPAAAQQYPPTSGGVAVTVTVDLGVQGVGIERGGQGVQGDSLDRGPDAGALPRTGSDLGLVAAGGLALLATGAFAVATARRTRRIDAGGAS